MSVLELFNAFTSRPDRDGVSLWASMILTPETRYNTRVGNDFVRGVSGGERKRVSIAEAALGGSPLQCWDNSTRGLDSATALEFVRTLRLSTSLAGSVGGFGASISLWRRHSSNGSTLTRLHVGNCHHFLLQGVTLTQTSTIDSSCRHISGLPEYLRYIRQGRCLVRRAADLLWADHSSQSILR